MKTQLLISSAIILAGVAVAHAQDASTTQTNSYSNSAGVSLGSDDLYRANELSLGVFGAVSGSDRRHDDDFGHHDRVHAQAGGGGDLEYFFSRYIGIEAEGLGEADRHNTTTAVGGNLVLRWPIGQTGLSPYIFGGAGYEWTYRSESYTDGGAGLEFRFTPHISIFADGRIVIPGSTRNQGMGRLGFRFVF